MFASNVVDDKDNTICLDELLQRYTSVTSKAPTLWIVRRVIKRIFPKAVSFLRRADRGYESIYKGLKLREEDAAPTAFQLQDISKHVPADISVVKADNSSALLLMPTTILIDGQILMKEIVVKNRKWHMKVRGKEVNLSLFGIENNLSNSLQDLQTMLRLCRSLPVCQGTKTHAPYKEHVADANAENSELRFRASICMQCISWLSESDACIKCMRCAKHRLFGAKRHMKHDILKNQDSSCGEAADSDDDHTVSFDSDRSDEMKKLMALWNDCVAVYYQMEEKEQLKILEYLEDFLCNLRSQKKHTKSVAVEELTCIPAFENNYTAIIGENSSQTSHKESPRRKTNLNRLKLDISEVSKGQLNDESGDAKALPGDRVRVSQRKRKHRYDSQEWETSGSKKHKQCTGGQSKAKEESTIVHKDIKPIQELKEGLMVADISPVTETETAKVVETIWSFDKHEPETGNVCADQSAVGSSNADGAMCETLSTSASFIDTESALDTLPADQSSEPNDVSVEVKSQEMLACRTDENGHKSESRKAHSCKICKKQLSSVSNLQVHMRTHNGERPFKCKACDKSFSTKGNKERHERSHDGIKPFKCVQCNQCFGEKKTLINHLRIHTGEKPYVCSVCGAAFSQRGSQISHEMLHQNVKYHVCDECGVAFRQKYQLTIHKRRRHSMIKPYSCSICSKSFVSNGDLKRHKKTHAPDSGSKSNGEIGRNVSEQRNTNQAERNSQHTCAVCSQQFSDVGQLTKHQIEHSHNPSMSLLGDDGDGTQWVLCVEEGAVGNIPLTVLDTLKGKQEVELTEDQLPVSVIEITPHENDVGTNESMSRKVISQLEVIAHTVMSQSEAVSHNMMSRSEAVSQKVMSQREIVSQKGLTSQNKVVSESDIKAGLTTGSNASVQSVDSNLPQGQSELLPVMLEDETVDS